MSKAFGVAVLMGVLGTLVQAQTPAPTGVVSAASLTLAGLPNGAIAEGSIFTVFGKNLGPGTSVTNASLTLPTTAGLGGTVMTITVNGVTTTAPMIYSSSSQLVAILPSATPVGTGTLSVTYLGVAGSTTPITVVATNFSTLTLNGSGTGPALIVDATNNYSVITATNSAAPGDVLVLYGTGLGPLPAGQNDAANPPVQVNLTTPTTIYVGTTQESPVYHGRSGDAGLDQINFTVPPGVSGCHVPVIIQTGTGSTAIVSNSTTIAVAPFRATACSDSNGLPLSSILPNPDGSLNVGYIALLQTTTTTPAIGPLPASSTTSSAAVASFYKYTAGLLNVSASLSGQPSLGGCVVNGFNVGSSTSLPVSATGLIAGALSH